MSETFKHIKSINAYDNSVEEAPPRDAHTYARQLAMLKTLRGNVDPFMVMDVQCVRELLDSWPKYLPRVQPFYSIDCNADPLLLRTLATHPTIVGFNCNTRVNVDIGMEFFPADRILYSNLCWTRSSLEQAKVRDVNFLSFESEVQLGRILLAHPEAELLLNVCMDPDSEDPMAQMGCPSGCPLDNATEVLQYAADMGARVVGIAFNLGNGQVRSALFSQAIECARGLFEMGTRVGLPLSVLNIGDGIPLIGSEGFREITTLINESLDVYFPHAIFPALKVIATPGIFFAQQSFSLVSNVVGRRSVNAGYITNDEFDSESEAFVYETNEGYYGVFGCRTSGSMGSYEPECYPLFANPLDHCPSSHALATVMGPSLGDAEDILQPICHFRPLNVGDWLLWPNMGAYTLNNCGSLELDERITPSIFYMDHIGKNADNYASTKETNMVIGCEESDDDAGSCGQAASLCTLGEEEENYRCEFTDELLFVQVEDEEEKPDLGILGWLLQMS